MGAGRQTRWIRRGLGAAVIGLFLTTPALAEVPHLLRYQGQAVDAKGVPLEGPHTLTVRLYDGETGGTPLWVETHPDVPLTGGHFSLLLGASTPLAPVDWTQPRWLAVQVDAEPELAPRQRITSVPLALRAETAEKLTTLITTSTITDDANRLTPSGAIILWMGASCPAGYTRLTALDGKFLAAGSSFNAAAGGSNTRNLQHNHEGVTGGHALTVPEMPSHTHPVVGRRIRKSGGDNEVAVLENTGDLDRGGYEEETNARGGASSHTHPLSNDLSSALDIRPEFATVLLCRKD
ncbi:MAG: hypothetical protein HY600_05720 [Candidatus Omnitrophica bacterium]|nr:hypothetical protein [Candidatus Omnitrophota bacterium]